MANLQCTGSVAGWCPICGNCTCPDRERYSADAECVLHGVESKHGEAPSWKWTREVRAAYFGLTLEQYDQLVIEKRVDDE